MKTFNKLLAVACTAGILTVFANEAQAQVIDSGTCGANLSWVLTSDSTLTISGSGAMEDYVYDWNTLSYNMPWNSNRTQIKTIVIGDSVTRIGIGSFALCSSLDSVTIGNNVTTIGEDAFWDCSSLVFVTIPNSVTSIGNWAFYECSSLASVIIGNSVTSIGDQAFSYSGLTSVTIPNSVTSINNAFSDCSSLASVIIGNSVTSIGSSAFENCSSLASVTIPNSVTSIGSRAFYSCSSLASVTIPNSVRSIGVAAFGNCISLDSVTIPNSVTRIESYTFSGCSSLTFVAIPNSVTIIGDWAFQSCSSLVSVTIPNSVTTIGIWAFRNCISLASVTFPESITTIGYGNFAYCISLASVTIPNSVTSIEVFAFDNCSSLASITTYAKNPPTLEFMGQWGAFDNVPANIPVYIPCGTFASYRNSAWGNYFTNFIEYTPLQWQIGSPDTADILATVNTCDSMLTLTITGTGAMMNFANSSAMSWYVVKDEIVRVIIDSGVTTIGDYAFGGCSHLDSVSIPFSINSIGTAAFTNCTALTDVYVEWTSPLLLSSYNPFDGITPLSNVNLHVPPETQCMYADAPVWQDFTIIGNRPVQLQWTIGSPDTADVLATVNTCDSTLTIAGTGAMMDFANSLAMPWYAVKDRIARVIIDSGVTTIGNYAFESCNSLASVILGNSVTTIGNWAFESCNSLASVILGNSVTTIGNWTFESCSSLISVTIPNSVTTIGNNAFQHCSNLSAVIFGNSVTSIGNYAFDSCSSVVSVTIGKSVTSIGYYAFYNCSSLASITIYAKIPPIMLYSFFYGGSPASIPVSIPCGTLDSYRNSGWGMFFANFIDTIGNTPLQWQIGTPNTADVLATFSACDSTLTVTGAGAMMNFTNTSAMPWYAVKDEIARIIIDNGVTIIGDYAFMNCQALTDVYVEWTTPLLVSSYNPFDGITPLSKVNLHVPAETQCMYADAPVWQDFTIIGLPIRCKTISGTVMHQDLTPLDTGRVLLFRAQTYIPMDTVPIEKDGTYLFTQVTNGDYVLKAESDNAENSLSTYYGNTEFWESAWIVTVENNSSVDSIDILMIQLSDVVNGSSLITGKVFEDDGQALHPAEGVGVYLQKIEQDDTIWQTIAKTTTDTAGSFAFGDIPDGTYRVRLDVTGVEIATPSLPVGEEDSLYVELIIPNPNDGISSFTQEEKKIKIYPNPTKGQITIAYGQVTTGNIQLFDMMGRLVFTSSASSLSHKTTIDISHLPAGVYLLRIDGGMGDIYTTKLVVMK